MKSFRIIPLVLCVACGGHQPAEQKRDTIPEAPKIVKLVTTDTPAVAPVTVINGNDQDSVPGPTLVFTTDLNYDSIPDTISLRTLARDTSSYDKITVSIAHYGKWSFRSGSRWGQVDTGFRGVAGNAYPTGYFYLAKNGVETALALFGWVGEVERDEFSIIRIRGNVPKLVFDQNHWQDNFIEVVDFIKDMDGDGRFEFGYSHMTEGENNEPEKIGGIITSYSPVMVYTIDDSLILNKPVMKKYNQENYVFAGYEYSSAIKVFYPSDRTKKRRLYKH